MSGCDNVLSEGQEFTSARQLEGQSMWFARIPRGRRSQPGPGVDGQAGRQPFRPLRCCRSKRSQSRSLAVPATMVDTENASFPPDAQVQDSEKDVPVLLLLCQQSVSSQVERRPEFMIGTMNRFEAYVKQRVIDQALHPVESQQDHLLAALAFDLTIEDTDTESIVGEKDIRTEPTRRKLVLIPVMVKKRISLNTKNVKRTCPSWMRERNAAVFDGDRIRKLGRG